MTKHLWEIQHDFYCTEGNYYSNQCHFEYKSWNDFLNISDNYLIKPETIRLNLLYRWDWEEQNDEGESNFTGDIYYRNGKLKLFYILQRKARNQSYSINVCRADEPAIIKFLQPYWQYLKDLWSPLND